MLTAHTWRALLAAALIALTALACERPGPPPPLEDGDLAQDADAADARGDADPDQPPEDMGADPDLPPDDMDTAPDLPPDDAEDMGDADMDPDALPPGQCRTFADCNTAVFEACFAGRCGDVYRVSAGDHHACALLEDRSLVCWGSAEYGAADAPEGLFLDVSAGRSHTCAVEDSNNGNDTGPIRCWGANIYGEATRPAGFFRQVSVGSTHSCALNQDNRARCWGDPDNPASSHAAAGDAFLTQISAGDRHNCALEFEGAVRCWGDNEGGQSDVTPGRYSYVTAGLLHSCAVREVDGVVVCWGDDQHGQRSRAPTRGGFTGVEARGDYTCAWTQGGGDVVCWGGHGTQPSTGSAGQLSVGAGFACAVFSDGELRCWGDNTYAQSSPPYGRVRAVAAGLGHTCVLDYEDHVRCWGDSHGAAPVEGLELYQLSQITANDGYTCGLVQGTGEALCWSGGGLTDRFDFADRFTQLSAGRFHACGILQGSGEVVCVGEDGDPNLTPPQGLRAAFVDAGELGTCALDTQGALVCWGLGEVSSPPERLSLSALSVGLGHACGVLMGSGEVTCWGEDEMGQASPPEGLTLRAISAGFAHSCGLTLEGRPVCWGRSGSEDLSYVALPDGEYLELDVTSLKSCALRDDERVVCQGYLGVLY